MTETPTLHLTVGLPGVGKTTLARKIAHEAKAVTVLTRRVDDSPLRTNVG